MNSNIFCAIIFICLVSCTCELICPNARIGSPVELICNHSKQTSTWVTFISPSDAEASCTPSCSSSKRFNISVVNDTQTRLTVLSVEWRDEGEWICKLDQDANNIETCNMNLFKIPTCHVSSDKATSVVTLGENVKLSLTVNNSYCTADNNFTLQTGQNNTEFPGQPGVNVSRTFDSAFNASKSNLGPVSTKFSCGVQHFDMNCSGVSNLTERDPPSCNITSDRLTDSLEINDSITLTVHVGKYPCSGVSQYKLNVGNVQNFLSNDTNVSVNTTLNLKLAGDHLEAKLNYICNNVNRNKSCTVVSEPPSSKGASYQEFPLYGILLLLAAILIVFIIATAIFIWKYPKWSPRNILNKF